MSVAAIILVILSALLHASWNIIGKSNKGSVFAFFFMVALSAALMLLPYLVWFYWQMDFAALSLNFYGLLLTSGLFQIVYLLSLGFAYQKEEVSLVYPIARALPVLLVGFFFFFSGQGIFFNEWIGFILITLGCLLVPLTTLKNFRLHAYLNRGVCWAIAAAIGTAGYSVVDKLALSLLSEQLHIPDTFNQYADLAIAVFFLGMQYWAIVLPLTLGFIVNKKFQTFKQAWQMRNAACLAGVLMAVTYGLVLYAMILTTNVSLVVALRQISIVFGLCLASRYFGEKWYITRGFGVIAIISGLVLALA
jgi:phosphonate utilization associated putative membrane protein